MSKESPIKIVTAAEELGVTYKTLYNWIASGILPMVHPGFVLMSEVRRASIRTANSKSLASQNTVSNVNRDSRGRFS